MKKIYGHALKDGVVLETDTTRVRCVRDKNNNIETRISKKKISKLFQRIDKIPIIRGVFRILNDLSMLLIFIITCFFDVLTHLFKYNNGFSYKMSNDLFHIITLVFNICAIVFIIYRLKNFKTTLKFHGAEHKVINTYGDGLTLTIENIKNSTKLSIFCGTIFAIFLIMFLILINLFIKISSLSFILSMIISTEIWKVKDKLNKPIIKWFYRLGLFLQKKFTVKEPTDEQIEVALICLNTLIKEEKQ